MKLTIICFFIILFFSFKLHALIAPTNNMGILILPNSITPNGDMLNDEFKVLNIDKLPWDINNFKILIYNRWGEEIFLSNDINFKWNAEGQELGNYAFYIQYIDVNKNAKIFKGDLMVIK